MRKWFIVILIIVGGQRLFAQNATPNAPVIDSVKAKWGKVKNVNGTKMISSNNIIENIELSNEYSVLVTAIEDAGLTETFKSKGPITFFAPTNQAFEKLPAGELDTLLKPSHKLELNYLITSHAIVGSLSVRDIQRKINSNKGEATFRTIAGTTLTAKIDANRNIVLIDDNGGKSIISKFDIQQSNGMLHIVNAVLVPKSRNI
ncbi:fasciclin domain-containing protein [Mucilaginibacter sp. BJC16-A38]|uniref:fasciclin domain-containing protein n=1 Tax=Mucilaginibacter phenanthrenivorans TaxID=1234842 RepID=UPI0021586976|nr:fasciclin domain-containing protein [Mucilaginibacter phenanthrenivorans]MCR8560631.1 fasciclin domain-containing protein [Mucilaginibacter phenanthrenivorans]